MQVTDIRQATSKDPTLSQVYSYTMRGWPNTAHSIPEKVKPFFSKRMQLSITNGCLLWGLQVIIPPQHQAPILRLFHEGHPGMSRMKSLARLHVWWPSIDDDIESFVPIVLKQPVTLLRYPYISGIFQPNHGNVCT